jgi:hypothetical protein
MKLFFTFNLTFLGLTAVIAVPEAQGEQSERRDAQLNYGDHCENVRLSNTPHFIYFTRSSTPFS